MIYPLFSIVIATYNSQKTLEKTLKSIKKQKYPQNKIEILAIDGGSTDKTLEIAKKYKCKILQNPKTELIYAKHIGFLKAQGKYLIFLDHDEILENQQSLKIKYSIFKKSNKIKSVMLSGYKTLSDFSPINYYTNEFGDPFTFFIYRESKGDKYFIKEWSNKYKIRFEDKDCVVFNFSEIKPLPLIELWAGGSTLDLEYTRNAFPQTKKTPYLIAHLFYLLNIENNLIAIAKNDSTIHYSSESLYKYVKKLSVRVKNNVYGVDMGMAGFIGREKFQPIWYRLKRYLFIPYSLFILPVLIDSIYLTLTRRKLLYLIHLPLCIYISLSIIYYSFLKILGIKPKNIK